MDYKMVSILTLVWASLTIVEGMKKKPAALILDNCVFAHFGLIGGNDEEILTGGQTYNARDVQGFDVCLVGKKIKGFVIMQRPGNDGILTLHELNLPVQGDKGTAVVEIAKAKPTDQSSTANEGISSKAVDGNEGQNYFNDGCTETNYEQNPWWSVKLGSNLRTIRFVKIFNREDCCGGRLQNFKILGSTHQNPNTGTTTLCAWYKGTSTDGAVLEIHCEKPVVAKYLAIQIIGDDKRLSLCEVNIYAETDKHIQVEIAKLKSTEQSSTAFSGPSSWAVDGNENQDYHKKSCSHTDNEKNPWWSVKLASKERTIRFVEIFNREDCCGERLQNFKVLGSTHQNPKSGTTTECAWYKGTATNGAVLRVDCARPVVARYLVIQIMGDDNYLTLCEVKIYVEKKNIDEVAKGKDTHQSSIDFDGVSDRAVDGNIGAVFKVDGCTQTQEEQNPWWSVSLGKIKIIRWVTIYNRADCCGERLHDFQVLGSDDANPNNGNTELCATRSGTLSNGDVVTVYCQSPISAAFVVIKIPSVNGKSDILTLCEVKVYATD